jgi:hypothetical protein
MPQNTTVTYPANTWTQITDASVTAIRVQNQSIFTVSLSATSSAVAPTNLSGAIELAGGETLAADLTLAQLFPGVTGATRLWVYPVGHPAVLSISHA